MPPTSGKNVVKSLQKDYGFTVVGKNGSHIKLKGQTADGNNATVIVPVHGNDNLPLGTRRSIEDNAGLPKGTFSGNGIDQKKQPDPSTPPVAGTPQGSSGPGNSQGSNGASTSNQTSHSSTIAPGKPGSTKDIPVNNDLLGPKIKDHTSDETDAKVAGSNTDIHLAPDVLGTGTIGKGDHLAPDVLGGTIGKGDHLAPDVLGDTLGKGDHLAPDVLGLGTEPRFTLSADPVPSVVSPADPIPVSDSAAGNQSDASSGGPMVAPSPYTSGAPVVEVSENQNTGVTQTTTSTGAVIDQAADGTPYRAGWVDPNNPNNPVIEGATNPYTSPPDAWQANASDIGSTADASPTGPPPPAYTGGAPVESASQNPQTGDTQTVTDTGAVIDQSSDGTPYRAGWVDPNNASNPVLSGASNPYTAAPDPWQANVAGISNSMSSTAPSAPSATNMVSDAASGGGYSNNDTSDTSPPTLGFSGPDVVPQNPSTGFAYGDADPYASPAPDTSNMAAAAPAGDPNMAPPPPPVAAPSDSGDDGGGIALPDNTANTTPIIGTGGMWVDPNTGQNYGDAQ